MNELVFSDILIFSVTERWQSAAAELTDVKKYIHSTFSDIVVRLS